MKDELNKDKSNFIRENRDMPREKLLRLGADSLEVWELIAILIGTGTAKRDVFDLSKAILGYAKDSLNNLVSLNKNDLLHFDGMGEAKIVKLLAAFELARRLKQEEYKREVEAFTDVVSCYKYLSSKLSHLDEEHFMVLLLNTKNEIIKTISKSEKDVRFTSESEREYSSYFKESEKEYYFGEDLVSKGTINQTLAMPREIFRKAIINNASSIIIAHNHPSGDPTPSKEDYNITKRLIESGHLLGIKVLDHIVIGKGRYYSFHDHGEI